MAANGSSGGVSARCGRRVSEASTWPGWLARCNPSRRNDCSTGAGPISRNSRTPRPISVSTAGWNSTGSRTFRHQ